MSINVKLGGVTLENVTQLPIKNKNNVTIATVELEEVGDSTNNISEYLSGDVTSISDSSITVLRKGAFSHCAQITDVSLPNCTTVNEESFKQCTALTNLSLPSCTVVQGNYSFQGCANLKQLVLPKASVSGAQSLVSSGVELVDVYEANNNQQLFSFCLWNNSALKTIIIRNKNKVSVAGSYGTPSQLQSVYVPESLLNEYKSASGWSAIANVIKPIEGSEYE